MKDTIKKVLILDDDISQKELWELVLKRHNKNVVIDWVISSSEAEELLKNEHIEHEKYDLIVIDLFLSGCSTGLDFLEKNKYIVNESKVVFSTSVLVDEFIQNLKIDNDHIKLLVKPINVYDCDKYLKSL